MDPETNKKDRKKIEITLVTMHRPFFSVIIPLYNKEQYIKRALYSVIQQEFRDFEIILVDDCSTDNGLLVATEFLKETTKDYKVIQRFKRGGSCAPARMTGCRYASGVYFAFLDADDEWENNFLIEIISLIEKFPEAEAFTVDRQLIDKEMVIQGSYGKKSNLKRAHIIDLDQFLKARFNNFGNPFRVQGMAFRPESLDDIGGFIHAPRSSDVDLYFRFFLSGKKAAWSPYIGLKIHRVPDSTIQNTTFQITRPWFYTIKHFIDRGLVSKRNEILLMHDINMSKIGEIIKSFRLKNPSLKLYRNLFIRFAPLTSILLYLCLIIPNNISYLFYKLIRLVTKKTIKFDRCLINLYLRFI